MIFLKFYWNLGFFFNYEKNSLDSWLNSFRPAIHVGSLNQNYDRSNVASIRNIDNFPSFRKFIKKKYFLFIFCSFQMKWRIILILFKKIRNS